MHLTVVVVVAPATIVVVAVATAAVVVVVVAATVVVVVVVAAAVTVVVVGELTQLRQALAHAIVMFTPPIEYLSLQKPLAK